jgi:DNA-binding CsgD family transcriptional regulator
VAERSDRPNPLTARQLECLTRIARGETSAEIGLALGLSKRTVDEYVGDACVRLGVKNRAQAVAVSIGLNIIDITSPP